MSSDIWPSMNGVGEEVIDRLTTRNADVPPSNKWLLDDSRPTPTDN